MESQHRTDNAGNFDRDVYWLLGTSGSTRLKPPSSEQGTAVLAVVDQDFCIHGDR